MQRTLAATILVSVALTSAAWAQTGTIRGRVVDPTGAEVAGAKITATHQAQGRTYTTVSQKDGNYALMALLVGPYQLEAEFPGFKNAIHTDIYVASGETVIIDITLETGAITETVAISHGYHAPAHRAQPATAPGPLALQMVAPPFNTEGYDRVTDSEFQDPRRNPLSTFSVDVDTASYANVRRFLNRGTTPPVDAVRIEELLNYFRYDYPDPAGEVPFSVTTEVGPCPWEETHRLVLVGLQGRRLDASQLPARNLVYLLDVSGSMQDPLKLPLLKAGLKMLTNTLTAKDSVAIVVYAGASGLVLSQTRGDDSAAILQAIDGLEAGGSTNGGAGIELAYRIARESFVKGGANRVILATDGDFNVGTTDMGSLTRLIEQERESGVFLSVLGFGTGNVKDATMVQLADRGNGNYSYIDSLQEARKVLVQEAAGTLVTIAKDVKLQVEFNPARVGAYRLIGYEKRLLRAEDFKDDKKDAGEIGAGHTVTALYEIAPVAERREAGDVDPLKYQNTTGLARAATTRELMTIKLRYKEPTGSTSQEIQTVVEDVATATTPTNLGFASAVAEFGLLLRDSEHKGHASWPQVLQLARQHRGADAHGHRGEFLKLAELAAEVAKH